MGLFESKTSKEELEVALTKAKNIVSSNPVVVFSKTHCPYCTWAKQLLTQLGARNKVIELHKEIKSKPFQYCCDGSLIQSALAEWTGQRIVPNVFIGGKHIGGCDTIVEKHQEGKLVPLLANGVPLLINDY